ncbi:MAG: DUF2341 domain-containing protein [Thermoplasmatales archaeon]|nr:DUF2341 domain-containing protein [Thermoplasmatales archaeon]
MRLVKCSSGVSHLFGYMLTLSLTTVIIAVTIITTNSLIDEKARDAAEIYAENIVNKVANSIMNLCNVKQQYPSANYSATIDIPWRLVDRFRYYVEIGQNDVYVKTYDGLINKHGTLYNATVKNNILISVYNGKIDSTNKIINISAYSYNYTCKFDFGNNSSELNTDYIKITNYSSNSGWQSTDFDINNWKYRTRILITNPLGINLEPYQILVQLNDTNFNYELANANGSDLRFVDKNGDLLNYWVERWYPRDTHTSRIWVNVTSLTYPECMIFMYYGKPDENPISNGYATFIFFDNFNETGDNLDTRYWYEYEEGTDGVTIDDGILTLKDGSAINSTVQVGYNPCVIEAKAKTTGDIREASIFARNKEDNFPNAPYSDAYIFTSGNFSSSDKNLAIYKTDEDVWDLEVSSGDPVSQGWNRLTYIINDTEPPGFTDSKDTVVCRYYYENYTVDGSLCIDTGSSYTGDGNFGLCTTEDYTVAYFDWIFVRNYSAVTDLPTGSSIEEHVPVAHVTGTDSRDFSWSNVVNVESKDCEVKGSNYDFVCNKGGNPVDFTIEDTSSLIPWGEKCSLLFTVGDPERDIDQMKITVTGATNPEIIDCHQTYKNIRIDITAPAIGNDLVITFDDMGGSDYYWAVGELTIQRGERKIDIIGG